MTEIHTHIILGVVWWNLQDKWRVFEGDLLTSCATQMRETFTPWPALAQQTGKCGFDTARFSTLVLPSDFQATVAVLWYPSLFPN